MTLLNTINVGGTDYGITGAAVLGSCATPAGSEVKVCTFSDNFELKAGDMLLVKFTYANTYGDGSTTYPKLQVNGTNYVMRRADGNYIEAGEWGNNATLTFLFDGTDFIMPSGSGSSRGSGVPLGTILAIHSNQVPDGYLPCNGVQFDTAQFAALYALLGDDHTPDLREVTLRGIGHNGTYVFDSTETDPSTGLAGTQNHDEYTLGQFKDDQIQEHDHAVYWSTAGASSEDTLYAYAVGNGSGAKNGRTISGEVRNARKGNITRGKSVGVNYIIKATSGLSDDQQDYILNQIAGMVEEDLSYSTEETLTGGKWIDGKPIYQKVLVVPTTIIADGNSYKSLGVSYPNDAETMFPPTIFIFATNTLYYNSYKPIKVATLISGGVTIPAGTEIIIEYTKATPST